MPTTADGIADPELALRELRRLDEMLEALASPDTDTPRAQQINGQLNALSRALGTNDLPVYRRFKEAVCEIEARICFGESEPEMVADLLESVGFESAKHSLIDELRAELEWSQQIDWESLETHVGNRYHIDGNAGVVKEVTDRATYGLPQVEVTIEWESKGEEWMAVSEFLAAVEDPEVQH